jgi:hypothetical protein
MGVVMAKAFLLCISFLALWVTLDWLAIVGGWLLGVTMLVGFLSLCIWAIVRLGKLNG